MRARSTGTDRPADRRPPSDDGDNATYNNDDAVNKPFAASHRNIVRPPGRLRRPFTPHTRLLLPKLTAQYVRGLSARPSTDGRPADVVKAKRRSVFCRSPSSVRQSSRRNAAAAAAAVVVDV